MSEAALWQRINDIFLLAARLPLEERPALLDQLCGSDETVRREVESLLAGDGQASAEGFLARPVLWRNSTRLSSPPEDPLTGRRLGAYLLTERIGIGGMGHVYRAVRAVDYHQDVAVKVIRPSLADDECRRRFQTERQTLADLNHPHIARLLDGGTTPEGLPYLVMEFIAGESLDQHCDRNSLTTAQRVALLREVCLAVQHAHERGVVHRDLKPSNVLVTTAGQPCVLDFGLAKVFSTESPTAAEQTRDGLILGTPGYMAPEQASAHPEAIGPPTDVYGLGAILYHLLTGRPPFRGNSLLDTLDMVRRDEPLSPRMLQPRLSRDLETVCLKCLQKDSVRRYASAAELAEELHRVLAGEPIRARPVSRTERLVRWSRRHPREAGLAAALLLLAVLAFSGVTSLWLLAEARGETARQETHKAEQQQQRAEELLAKADQVVEDYFTRVAEDSRLKTPELASLRRELLGAARDHYIDLVQRSQGTAKIDQQLATAYSRLALAHRARGALGEAREAARQALDIRLRLVENEPGSILHRDKLAIAYENLGTLLESDDVNQAITLTRAGWTIREALARELPDDPKRTCDLFYSAYNLGHMLGMIGADDEGVSWMRRACAEGERMVRAAPNDNGYRDLWATSRDHLAFTIQSHRPEEAGELFLAVWKDRLDLVRREPLNTGYVSQLNGTLDRFADYLERNERKSETTALRSEACEAMRRSVEQAALADSRQLDLEGMLLDGRFKQGQLALSLKQTKAAETAFREVLTLGERLTKAKRDDPEVRRMIGIARERSDQGEPQGVPPP